jgi:hypothetical protein
VRGILKDCGSRWSDQRRSCVAITRTRSTCTSAGSRRHCRSSIA